jgi:excisionase family DNA binding protein
MGTEKLNNKLSQDDKPITLTVSEVSRMLNISRGSAYEAIQQGQIPHIRIGRRILIPRKAFERLLESCRQDMPRY